MRWIALLLCLIAHGLAAETIRGKVVKIADGDTLTILDARRQEHRIRLTGIDAPERKQAHYETSRQSLAKLAFGKGSISGLDPRIDLRAAKIDGFATVQCGVSNVAGTALSGSNPAYSEGLSLSTHAQGSTSRYFGL